jgi:hypothetical protein
LGEDYAAAVDRAENILLPAFDSWRSRGLSDMVPASPALGSFDWLVSLFNAHQKWKEIDHKTQRLYEQGLALFANHKLKDGARAGSKQISDFTKGFVDAIYAKLLVVDDMDAEGNIVKRERRRFANASMVACRRAWFVGQRAQEKKVTAVNPFSRMGLKARAPGQPVRKTPTATWEELVAFRAEAKKLGYGSVATAALVAWGVVAARGARCGAFGRASLGPVADQQLMLEQDKLSCNPSHASRAEQFREGNEQMDRQDEQIAHEGKIITPANLHKTAPGSDLY